LSQEIRRAGEKAGPGGEANLRQEVQESLKAALRELEIEVEVRLEKTLRTVYHSRRADAVYPALVLEYKSPGLLRHEHDRKSAVSQLKDGLRALAGDGSSNRKFVGVALDGENIMFVRAAPITPDRPAPSAGRSRRPAPFQVDGPHEVTPQTVERLLRYFQYLSHRFLTAETLATDFGSESTIAGDTIRLLVERVKSSNHPRVTTLFDEWKRLFGIVYGEGSVLTPTSRRRAGDLAERYGLAPDESVSLVLFAVHTYFALVMKLVAAEVLARSEGSYFPSFSQDCANMDDAKLHDAFQDLESGGLFNRMGIANFLEGDFFSWYLSEWDSLLAKNLRALVVVLSEYDTRAATLDPSETRDILKHLYQFLVPKSVRHDLGEYYTPDWVADLVLDEVDYHGDPSVRLLDPACGSGTFLTLAISRAITYGRDHPESLAGKSLLELILHNIVGFDINPIAVLAARTNFLISTSSLRKPSHVEIPVYLCDSVLAPEEHEALPLRSYTKETSVGTFEIPATISGKGKLERVLAELDATLSSRQGTLEGFLERVRLLLSNEEFENSEGLIRGLFTQIAKLEEQGKNRIWTRILKNSFAPLHVGRFEVIAGNPPWINWESLSGGYRKATADLWEEYGLLAKKGGKQFELGKQKRDFSTLFTLVCAKQYLETSGRLSFVITQSIFKSEGGDGFRRFRLDDRDTARIGEEPGDNLVKPTRVHDLVNLKPFEEAANRTAVLTIQRGQSVTYPVPYIEWVGQRGHSRSEDESLESVRHRTRRTELAAIPVDPSNPKSAWLTLTAPASAAAMKVLGTSSYEGHAGTSTTLNGVFWVRVLRDESKETVLISNLNEVGDTELPAWQGVVDKKLLWPLLRGRDVSRWRATPSAHIILPHLIDEGWKPIPEQILEKDFFATFRYFSYFHEILSKRSTYRQLRIDYPFYTLVGVGAHTFTPIKVVWRDMSTGMAATVLESMTDPILGRRLIIPDHHVFFVSCRTLDEAHYLSAVLNSSPASCVAAHHGSWGPSTKIPSRLRIPTFDPDSPVHLELANLSRRAHKEALSGANSRDTESIIDLTAAKLWGLSRSELSALKEDLARLSDRPEANELQPAEKRVKGKGRGVRFA